MQTVTGKAYLLDRGETVLTYDKSEKRPETAVELYNAFRAERDTYFETIESFDSREAAMKELSKMENTCHVRPSVLRSCEDIEVTIFVLTEMSQFDDDDVEETGMWLCENTRYW